MVPDKIVRSSIPFLLVRHGKREKIPAISLFKVIILIKYDAP
jgi:hypothetical protein